MQTIQNFTDADYQAAAAVWDRIDKIAAARRALSICNKLKPSATKSKNVKRIFAYLNKARAA